MNTWIGTEATRKQREETKHGKPDTTQENRGMDHSVF